MSADGNIVAIGSPYGYPDPTYNNRYGTPVDTGRVRVQAWNGAEWIQMCYQAGQCDIPGESTRDDSRSGTSVAMSADGTILAIGAPQNYAFKGWGSVYNAGSVRVYKWDGTGWNQRGSDVDGAQINDYSGESVALSADGTILAIGADGNDGTGSLYADNRGHVRVYDWDGDNVEWTLRAQELDGEATSDYSGFPVRLSANGNVIAIGAPNNDGVNGTDTGHVRVYDWDSDTALWYKREPDLEGEGPHEYYSASLAISADGTIVAIGTPYNDAGGLHERGHVRVHRYNGTRWGQMGLDIDGEAAGDYSGISIAMSADGTILAIGAPNNDGNGVNNAGHVRVYAWDGDRWNQAGGEGTGDIDGAVADDNWGGGKGLALSADGTLLAVSSRQNDYHSTAGRVRFFAADFHSSPPLLPPASFKKASPMNLRGFSGWLSASALTTLSRASSILCSSK
jgi:hypothetical protein